MVLNELEILVSGVTTLAFVLVLVSGLVFFEKMLSCLEAGDDEYGL